MTKEILIQYSDVAGEVKDIRKRLEKIKEELSSIDIVSDSVKGTRPNGTYGNIKITGYPTPRWARKMTALNKNKELLEKKEEELLELMTQAEEYIESIPKSELRTMFRLYYIDGKTWIQVAHQMNNIFPKRMIPYTEDNCKQKNKRFFEKF